MKDLRFTKEHAYCDFTESEELENIKSGESLGVIFGKIRTWIKSVRNGVGKSTAGEKFIFGDEEYTAWEGAEIFNDYEHNIAVDPYSTAMGTHSTAIGSCSFSAGCFTTAYGHNSSAQGSFTTAVGDCSHADGHHAVALSKYSRAFGRQVSAASELQTVIGCGNIIDDKDKFAFIIGNGKTVNEKTEEDKTSVRSNAFAVDWNGNIYIGNSTIGINLLDLVSRIETLEAKAESSICEISENEIDNIC